MNPIGQSSGFENNLTKEIEKQNLQSSNKGSSNPPHPSSTQQPPSLTNRPKTVFIETGHSDDVCEKSLLPSSQATARHQIRQDLQKEWENIITLRAKALQKSNTPAQNTSNQYLNTVTNTADHSDGSSGRFPDFNDQAESLYNQGLAYYEGKEIHQSFEDAAKFFSHAATLGHVKAQFCIARMYKDGKGVDQNLAK